jgi:hypothetical protein
VPMGGSSNTQVVRTTRSTTQKNQSRLIVFFDYDGFLIVSTTCVDFFCSAVFTVVNCPVFALRPILMVFFAIGVSIIGWLIRVGDWSPTPLSQEYDPTQE